MCFSQFSRVPWEFFREFKCLSLIVLNNGHLWPRQHESIFWKLWWRWNCEYLAQRIFLRLQHNSTEGMYVCVHVQTSIVSIQTLCWFLIFIYCMTGNIDVELNLMVGEITHVWPNFIPFYALKTLNAYTLISKCVFQIARLLWHVPLDLQVSRLTKVSVSWSCLWKFCH